MRCINILESPDPLSRSINDEGRRIRKVDGGYFLINYQKYRDFTYSDNPEAVRKRKQREERDNMGHVPTCPDISGHSASASASSSVLKKENIKEKERTWRTSFWFYRKMVILAYREIINSPEKIKQQQELNPNLDIILSIKKGVINFWGNKAGWKYKRGKKSAEINMKSTLINSIDHNRVFKPRNQQGQIEQSKKTLPHPPENYGKVE
jgi:hypothetical protein